MRKKKPKKPKVVIPLTLPSVGGALKLDAAAQYLGGLNVVTLRRAIKDGKLRPCRQFRHMLLPIRELDRFLAEGQ
jgi:helix-turn-helix protein